MAKKIPFATTHADYLLRMDGCCIKIGTAVYVYDPGSPARNVRNKPAREGTMNMDKFSESVTIGGEIYEYDPKGLTALIPCENCGHMNVVNVNEVEGEFFPASFVCENCGHWNSFE
jgi:hypothetical protein